MFEPVEHDPAISTFTREEASLKLVELEQKLHPLPPVKPTDAQGARHRLTALANDVRWSKALMNGEPAATKEFHELVALSASADDVGDAIAGIVEDPSTQPVFETVFEGQLSRRDTATAVADFRSDGLDDGSIAMALNGGSVSLAEHRAATALLNARKADPAWVKALTSGDHLAKREWTLLCTILSCSIAEPT
jgi:hypothetical protein